MSVRTAVLFILAAALLILIAWSRGGEYDEYYSIFLITGHARPAWPTTPTTVASLASFFHGHASFGQIATNLRRGDVHPPLYFWLLSLWRRLVGLTLFRLRLLSVLLTLASLAILSRITTRIGAPRTATIAITLLSYGFSYTGIVTRNFALTGLFSLTGILLLIEAGSSRRITRSLAGGVLFSAACFTNYLASFTTIAALLWFLIVNRRQPRHWIAASLGAGLFIPAGLWFFMAQAGSRHGQFHHFRPLPAMIDLARDQAGAVLGALPRYLPHDLPLLGSLALEIILAIFAIILIIGTRLSTLSPRHRALIITLILAQPIGLLTLGALFDTTPIEVRYLWLGLPFIALALATSLQNHPIRLIILLTIQSAAIIGLAIAPQTMQPAARTAVLANQTTTPHTLVIIPFGNDGVGIPGPFIADAKPTMTILIARHPPNLAPLTRTYRRLVIAQIMVDTASRALIPTLDATIQADPCWTRQPTPTLIETFINHCRTTHG